MSAAFVPGMKLLFLNVQVIKKLKKLHDISSRLLVPERGCESPAQLTGVMTYVHIHTLFSWGMLVLEEEGERQIERTECETLSKSGWVGWREAK